MKVSGPLIVLFISLAASACDRGNGEAEREAAPTVSTTPRLPEGMEVDIRQEGSGDPVGRGRMVSIHYTGRLQDGTVFDRSVERNQPLTFTMGLGSVIRGLELGMKGMRVGEIRHITIPPRLGYGDRRQGKIPPDSVLVFEVELLEAR